MSDYVLTLRSLPGDAPPEIRLRKLLKLALRTCRFRCIGIQQKDTTTAIVEDATTPAPSEPPTPQTSRKRKRASCEDGQYAK